MTPPRSGDAGREGEPETGGSPAGSGGAVDPGAAAPALTSASNPERSEFAAGFSRPDELYLSAEDLARSAGISALILVLLGFPARLFNATVKVHRLELEERSARVRRALARLAPRGAARLLGIAGTSIVAGTAVYVFLDPSFPSRKGALPFALGMLIGITVVTANLVFTWRAYMRRRLPDVDGGWVVYPGQIAVSVLCVAVSRIAHFVPGLMLGMAGDYEPRRALDLEHLGCRTAFTSLCLEFAGWESWGVGFRFLKRNPFTRITVVLLKLGPYLGPSVARRIALRPAYDRRRRRTRHWFVAGPAVSSVGAKVIARR